MRVGYSSIFRGLWLALAVALPLFSVEFLRLNNEALHMHVAVPMFVVGVIMILNIFVYIGGRRAEGRVPSGNLLGQLGILFLLWHVVALIPAYDAILGFREVCKLALGLLAMWTVGVAFPRDPAFMRRFWGIALFSSTVLMSFLIYQYHFRFHAAFLSNNLDESTRYGRNQLTAYLVYIFPFAVARLILTKNKIRNCAEPLVLAGALVYAGSRAAILSTICGLLFLVWYMAKLHGIGKTLGVVFWGIFIGLGAFFFVSHWIPNLEVVERVLFLFDPSSAPQLNSYHERGWRIMGGVNLFLSSPLMGVGLTNSDYELGTLTHNDYSQIMAETGAVGILLFVGILATVGRRLLEGRVRPAGASDWSFIAPRIAFPAILVSLSFTNSYTTLFLWLFLGMCLVQVDIDQRANEESAPSGSDPALPKAFREDA